MFVHGRKSHARHKINTGVHDVEVGGRHFKGQLSFRDLPPPVIISRGYLWPNLVSGRKYPDVFRAEVERFSYLDLEGKN